MRRRLLFMVLGIALGIGSSAPAQGIVRAEGRYFIGEDGEPFLVVGHNEGLGWPYIRSLWQLPQDEAEVIVGDYFRQLSEDGVNTIRLFANYPATGIYLQEGDGSLVEEEWRRLERVVDIADRHDIYVLLGPWDPFWTERHWEDDPLNAANGGPLKDFGDFFTSPQAREHQRIRLRALVDRLGGRRNILAWELLNEADLWWRPNPQAVSEWYAEMAAFVRQYEQERWGRSRMIGLSAGKPVPDEDWRPVFYDNPLADFVSTHFYMHGVAEPDTPLKAARHTRDAMLLQFEMMGDRVKPFIETENGPYEPFVVRDGEHLDEEFDARVYMAVCWAHVAGGGAGQPMRWPYRIPHTLSEEMRRVQRIQAEFFERFPFAGFDPSPIAASAGDDSSAIVTACADETRGIVHVVRDGDGEAGVSIELHHVLRAGAYEVKWLDPWTGAVLAVESWVPNGDPPFSFDLENAPAQVVLSIEPRGEFFPERPSPNPPRELLVNVAGPAAGTPVQVECWNPLLGRVRETVLAGDNQPVELSKAYWRIRAWADGFLPATTNVETRYGGSTPEVGMVLHAVRKNPRAIHQAGYGDSADLMFWTPARIEGSVDGGLSVRDGALEIRNPRGSRFGAMSPRLRLADGDAVAFSGVLESFEGLNTLVCIYGGDGGFEDFVEFDISHDTVNLWSPVEGESCRFTPTTVRPPVVVKMEARRVAGAVRVEAYYDGELAYRLDDVQALKGSEDVAIFLYGWDATVRWADTIIEGAPVADARE